MLYSAAQWQNAAGLESQPKSSQNVQRCNTVCVGILIKRSLLANMTHLNVIRLSIHYDHKLGRRSKRNGSRRLIVNENFPDKICLQRCDAAGVYLWLGPDVLQVLVPFMAGFHADVTDYRGIICTL